MDRPSVAQKPARHALRLDWPSIAQSALALLLACSIAYLMKA